MVVDLSPQILRLGFSNSQGEVTPTTSALVLDVGHGERRIVLA